MSKRFDAEKFRTLMQDMLGGQYISILTDITKASRTAVNRWVDSGEAPIKGPKPEYQERISTYFKQKLGYTLIWGDLMSLKEESHRTGLDVQDSDFNVYEALLEAKKEINSLNNIINDLKNELFLKEQENIQIRAKLAGFSSS